MYGKDPHNLDNLKIFCLQTHRILSFLLQLELYELEGIFSFHSNSLPLPQNLCYNMDKLFNKSASPNLFFKTHLVPCFSSLPNNMHTIYRLYSVAETLITVKFYVLTHISSSSAESPCRLYHCGVSQQLQIMSTLLQFLIWVAGLQLVILGNTCHRLNYMVLLIALIKFRHNDIIRNPIYLSQSWDGDFIEAQFNEVEELLGKLWKFRSYLEKIWQRFL